MNALVLGAAGMAGHVISTYLREHGHTIDTLSAHNRLDHSTYLIDVTDQQTFHNLLANKQYNVVINCIASLVRQSEVDKDTATYLNAYLPLSLENYYAKTNTKVIHLSTDGVFSGKNSPYNESSDYDEQSFYGRSKALGEIINDKDLTIRTSIIGPDLHKSGEGLFNWFYRQSGNISGFSKVMWQGVTTIELAKHIEEAINQNITGVCHLVPMRHISKYTLLELCKETFCRTDVSIEPNAEIVFKRDLISTRSDFSPMIPEYKDMVDQMKVWINTHKHLYPHYS